MVLPPLSASMTGVSSLSATHAWPFMCIQHSEPWLPRCQLRKLEPTAQDKPPGLCHRTHCTCWVNFTLGLYLQYCQINIGEVSDGCGINSSRHQGLLQTITSLWQPLLQNRPSLRPTCVQGLEYRTLNQKAIIWTPASFLMRASCILFASSSVPHSVIHHVLKLAS